MMAKRHSYSDNLEGKHLGDSIKCQGYGDNPAWTLATVTAPASISDCQDHNGGGQYVSASSWQDCPTGPPLSVFFRAINTVANYEVWKKCDSKKSEQTVAYHKMT